MLKFVIASVALLAATSAAAQVHVRGYTRSDGTYVAPHTRSSPDSSVYNNRPYRPPSYTAPTYRAPTPLYVTPPPAAPAPRTQWVNGYTRRDGTYVQGYMRSPGN